MSNPQTTQPNSARAAILANVRKSLGASANDPARRATADAHLTARARHPIPERVAGKDAASLKELFRTQLETAGTTVLEVDAAEDVPQAVADYLRGKNLPQTIRMGSDPDLTGMPWGNVPSLEVTQGPAAPEDTAGLSKAVAGVAETGTMMLASGSANPVTLNFLPETHLVVVAASSIVGPYEDGFSRVRETFGDSTMPRTVNLISGPSRTGDIGGRIVMGAHGPRQVCVVIVNGM